MDNKKVIACDLDGTLTESKSELSKEMSDTICRVLSKHYMAVVSGGAFHQYQDQFLSRLSCGGEQLKNLFLFPTNGSAGYSYENSNWKLLYEEPLDPKDKDRIISSLNRAIKETGLDLSGAYGEI